MKKQLKPSEFRAKFPHESPHVTHVRNLALKIFDGVSTHLKLTDTDRRMLEAAADLHDIALFRNQREHAIVSAEMIMGHGLKGFTSLQTNQIAAAILLHSKRYDKRMRHPIYSQLSPKTAARKIGAILRVADGLDHGHIQDAEILSIKKTSRSFKMIVRSDGCPANIRWALDKADLWKKVFKVPLKIELQPAKPARFRYQGIVSKKNSFDDAVRLLLFTQFKIIGDNLPGAVDDRDPEHLHDIRVAMRRLKSLLTLFAGPLDETTAASVKESLTQIADQLGTIRDTHIWLAFLEQPELNIDLSHDHLWSKYYAYQQALKAKHQQRLKEILGSDAFWQFWEETSFLLRVELPQLKNTELSETSLPSFVAGKILKLHNKLPLHKLRLSKQTSVQVHEIRKKYRRARYWAEFAAPFLGQEVKRYAKILNNIADALGEVHDVDLHIEKLDEEVYYYTDVLKKRLKIIRDKNIEAAEKNIKALSEKKFAKNFMNHLEQIERSEK